MTKTSLIICFLISTLCSFSQPASTQLASLYDTAFIQKYSESKFKLNNKTLKRKELRHLLLSKPESAEAYKAYRKSQNVANVLWTAAGVAYVGSLVALGYNPDLAVGLLAGSVAVMLTTIPSEIKSDRSIHKAVWLYNRAVLSTASTSSGK